MKVRHNRIISNTIKYVLFHLRTDRGSTLCLISLRIFSALLPAAKMLLLAIFVDEALLELQSGAFSGRLLTTAGVLVGVMLLEKAAELLDAYLNVRFSTLITAAHEERLVEKKSRLCFSVLEDADAYELMCRVMDEQSGRMVEAFENLMVLTESILRILFVAIAVAVLNHWCGLFVLLAFLMILPVAKKNGSESWAAYEDASKYYKISRYLRKVLSARDYVGERTQYAYTPTVQTAWDNAQEQARLREKQAVKKDTARSKLLNSVIATLAALLYGLMLIPLSRRSITVGAYVSVVTTSAQFISLLTWSYAVLAEKFEEHQQYAKDLEAFLALPEDELEPQERAAASVCISRIEFRNVSFCYPGCEQPILDRVSFCLESGSSYALVGRNGAGKTTVIKLLTGLYTTYDGEILINGAELRKIDRRTRQSLFSIIYQDFARYELSVRENLTIGCAVPPEETELHSLVDSLGLREKIDRMPQGLNTNLGRLEEIGIDFSGGEWQRIAIARALLKHAPILIMDEPTASLDPLHERSIFQLFAEHSRQASISILITHRLGGIKNVDRIIVLENGTVCEQGTHEALIGRQGVYAKLYAEQEKWYQ